MTKKELINSLFEILNAEIQPCNHPRGSLVEVKCKKNYYIICESCESITAVRRRK